MELFQTLLMVLMLLTLIMFYATITYKRKKEKEYGNDERWKGIVAAAMRVVYHYYAIVLVLTVFGNAAYRMIIGNYLGLSIQLGLGDVFGLLYVVLFGASAIEFIAFRVYDRKM